MARIHEEEPAVFLDSGLRAVVREDRFTPGAFELVVDGTPQSHVDLDDPGHLSYEYVRRMGHVIDQLPPGPITALHLGAGAFTLPRYIHETRPGSRQQVIELERSLVELVRREIPLPPNASIRVRYGDAREVLHRLPAGLRGAVDVLVVDVFGGGKIPPQVTSLEFYRACVELLGPTGILLVNVADGAGGRFARGQTATIHQVANDVAVLAEASVLAGRRFGNLVLAASPSPLPVDWLPRLLAAGPFPGALVHGRRLRDWVAGAHIVTDQTATGSPDPDRSLFSGFGGSGP